MSDKDFFTQYTVSWKQEYLEWYNFVDTISEAMIESSDMKEANELIESIKSYD
jgi:hypothetical protein